MTVSDNYDRLFYEPEALARSTRYTHHVDGEHILRTHTTAAIPELLAETASDRFLVCPGLVYRRDVVDRLHVGEPHQVDLWIARRGRLRRADLMRMIDVVVTALLPGHAYRCNETWHPYTVNGLEVEVAVGERWVELFECGEIHPWLLNESGLPSQEATWQRCRVHWIRNALAHVSKGQHTVVAAAIRQAFEQPDRKHAGETWRHVAEQLRTRWPKLADLMDASEHDVLAYMAFPRQHRTKLHSTNPIERLNKEVKRRADVVGIFPNEASIMRLIGAMLFEQNDE